MAASELGAEGDTDDRRPRRIRPRVDHGDERQQCDSGLDLARARASFIIVAGGGLGQRRFLSGVDGASPICSPPRTSSNSSAGQDLYISIRLDRILVSIYI